MRIIDLFDQGAAFNPENIAFKDATGQCSFAEAREQSHLIALALYRRDFRTGTHIGVLVPNGNILFCVLLGIFRLGAVCIPINPRLMASRNACFLGKFDCQLLFYHSLYKRTAQKIAKRKSSATSIVCIDERSNFGESLQTWMHHAEPYFPPVEYSCSDTFMVLPAGGSTGPVKGLALSHRSIASFFTRLNVPINNYNNCRHLVIAPMSHWTGIMACLYFSCVGTNIIPTNVDPGGILRAIAGHGITHLFAPSTLLHMMLSHPYVELHDYSSVEHFIVGAPPVSVENLQRAVEIFGPVVTESDFGMDEQV